jgi:hypothetical protein
VFFPPKGAGSAEGAERAAAGGTLRLSKKALKRRAAEAEAHVNSAEAGVVEELEQQGGDAAAGSC